MVSAPVVVIGNVAIDRIDGGDPRPGGCPSFAALGLRLLDRPGHVLTRCAAGDRGLFEPFLAALGVPVTLLAGETTSAFGLHYTGEERSLTVDAIGDVWTPADVAGVGDGAFVHVAPLLRTDFPEPTLAALAARGCTISYDGQGLVRAARVGPLLCDASFDRALLSALHTLKLSEEEAEIVADGAFDEAAAESLGVPEIILTLGSRGAVVFAAGAAEHVPAARPVLGVQTTGAGDLFMVGYVTARSQGAGVIEAVRVGSALVADVLEERRMESGAPRSASR